MNKNHSRNHCAKAGTLHRSLALLVLPFAIAAGSLDAAPPVRSVFNAYGSSVTEGHEGIQHATVTVTLDAPRSGKSVSVKYRTYGGTATAGSDYDAVSGTLTFAAGETTKTISVPIRGDRIGEWLPNQAYDRGYEFFYVELYKPTSGATLGYSYTATVEIWEDEPRLKLSGTYDYEGNSGTTPFRFTVSMWPASDEAVTVGYATQDFTALAGIDYVSASGTLTLAPGETSKTITVDVIGNTLAEPNKLFFLNLDVDDVPTSIAVTETSVFGQIEDDDGYYGDGYYDYYYGW